MKQNRLHALKHNPHALPDLLKPLQQHIASLKQQAEVLLRGQMGIESTAGRGTRVVAVVPAP